jgi:hypothetical protein
MPHQFSGTNTLIELSLLRGGSEIEFEDGRFSLLITRLSTFRRAILLVIEQKRNAKVIV